MVHGTGLRNSAKTDTGIRGEVGAKLAGFAFVKAAVILPKRLILIALLSVAEREDGDGCHFTVAACYAKVARNILTCALGTLVDTAADTTLCRRIGIERVLTVYALADHGNLVGVWEGIPPFYHEVPIQYTEGIKE